MVQRHPSVATGRRTSLAALQGVGEARRGGGKSAKYRQQPSHRAPVDGLNSEGAVPLPARWLLLVPIRTHERLARLDGLTQTLTLQREPCSCPP